MPMTLMSLDGTTEQPITDSTKKPDKSSEDQKRLDDLMRPLPKESAFTPENITALLNSTMGSGLESTGTLAGMLSGGKLGTELTHHWAGTLLGGLAGGALGSIPAGQLRDYITQHTGYLQRPENLPPEQRPMAYGGEVIGGSLPYAVAPYLAAATGYRPTINQMPETLLGQAKNDGVMSALGSVPERIGIGIQNMPARAVQNVIEHPIKNIFTEAGPILGSAAFGASAESLKPGNSSYRTKMELLGGLPSVLLGLGMSTGNNMIQSGKSYLSKNAVKDRASQYLRKGIESMGGNPDDVAAQLAAQTHDLPTAFATDDPFLRLFSNKITSDNAVVNRQIADKTQKTLGDISNEIGTAGQGADALKTGMKARYDAFRKTLDTTFSNAKAASDAAANAITSDQPQVRTQLSQKAQDIVENSLKAARNVEREYYAKVPQDISGQILDDSGDGILATLNSFASRRLPHADQLPPVITQNVQEFSKNPPTIGQLNTFRSRMLDMARNANDPNAAVDRAVYLGMAEAAKNDISHIVDASGNQEAASALNDARQFSRELHDSFTRTFAGDAVKLSKTGEEAILPETLLKRAFSSGNEVGETQLGQLRSATEFLPSKGFGDQQAVTDMRNIQDRYLRLKAAGMQDPLTGEINKRAMTKWMSDNQGTLNAFPELRKDLTNAINANNSYEALATHYRNWTTPQARKSAFAEVMNNEDPARVLRDAEASRTPTAALTNIANAASRSGPAAREGLAATTFQNIIDGATGPDGAISFTKLKQNFDNSQALRVFQGRKVINDTQMAWAKKLVDEGARIEAASGNADQLKNVDLGSASALEDYITKLVGVHAGSNVAPRGPGAILTAGASARLAKNILNDTPLSRMNDTLTQAMLNKDMAADLLRRTTSEAQRNAINKRTNAWLIRAGITPVTQAMNPQEEDQNAQ